MSSELDAATAANSDLAFEEELLRYPYSVRHWLRYVAYKQHIHASAAEINIVYERAVKDLPGSYKLWKRYMEHRLEQLQDKPHSENTTSEYDLVNDVFERSLMLMHRMPRIWLMYLTFLLHQPCVTLTRRTFDRALRALAPPQHARVWELYVPFVQKVGGETAYHVLTRYLKFEPSSVEDYVDMLIEQGKYNQAAKQLIRMCNDPEFTSTREQTQSDLWNTLVHILSSHPGDMRDINVDKILRAGMRVHTNQVGKIWCALAQFWILQHKFDVARDMYEEGIATAKTVRDFTQIFDAYAEFEESVLAMRMDQLQSGAVTDDSVSPATLDLRLARLERLMDKRAFLVNDVLLRQNPHNVQEWMKRIELVQPDAQHVLKVYMDAIQTIQPKKATDRLCDLWVNFAKWYESSGDVESAEQVLEKAVLVEYKSVHELVDVWCKWAEMHLARKDYHKALEILGRATAVPTLTANISYRDDTLPPQKRLFKSLKLWSFYADLEESVGNMTSAKAVYDQMLSLKIANPQTILNYATFLEEQHYFEESFKVYQRGIDTFGYPIAFEIWNVYLPKFAARYGATKLERTRDLFEQALVQCPPKNAFALYVMYGKMEEQYGLMRNAMGIYERGTQAVDRDTRLSMYRYYINKAAQVYGLVSTRPIYQSALDVLPDSDAKDLCMEFAEMECKLGEIDRARALYAYASQFCDPTTVQDFWTLWNDFEVKHGNEDTFKEMLRIKRSVQAQYSTQIKFISAQILAQDQA